MCVTAYPPFALHSSSAASVDIVSHVPRNANIFPARARLRGSFEVAFAAEIVAVCAVDAVPAGDVLDAGACMRVADGDTEESSSLEISITPIALRDILSGRRRELLV